MPTLLPAPRLTDRKDANSPQFRSAPFERAAINIESRTIEFALASEEPYQRWWGIEVLSHDSAAVRLGRLNDGRHPLLVEHSTRDQVGVIEKAWIGPDRTLRCTARFGNSERACEIFQDVCDGIRSLVSVGYQIHSLKLVKSDDVDGDTYMVDDWEPFEGSIVAVPADASVGIGRDGTEDTHLRSLLQLAKGKTMPAEKETVLPGSGNDTSTSETTQQRGAAQPKDHSDVSRNATAVERQRVKDIAALGEKFGERAAATAAIEDGTPYDAFRERVFDNLAQSGKLKLAEPGKIGLTDKEARNFRFSNLILATMFPNERGLQEAAAFEIECSRAAVDKRQDSRKDREHALCIPIDVLSRAMDMNAEEATQAQRLYRQMRGGMGYQQRDLNVTTSTAGGNLVATELLSSSFIDLLVNEMAIMSLGSTMLNDLQGNIAIPRATAGATGYWVAENSSPTESQQAFDQVAMTPKTVGAFVDYTRRLLLQSSIAVEAFIRMDIARQIALLIDLAAINGSGASNQPRGILNTSGIGSVAGGTNGLAPTWDNIVDLESAVANANAPTGNRNYLTNTKVRGKLKRTLKFAVNGSQEIWQADGLNGYPARVSNQVPSNLTKGTSSGVCSAIIFGNWTDLLIGMWGGLDMMLDPYTGGTAGTKRVIALQDVDVNVRYPVSFSAMVDALTV